MHYEDTVQIPLFREKCKEQTSLTTKQEAIVWKELAELGDTSAILPKNLFLTKRVMYTYLPLCHFRLQRQEITCIKLQGLTAKRKYPLSLRQTDIIETCDKFLENKLTPYE